MPKLHIGHGTTIGVITDGYGGYFVFKNEAINFVSELYVNIITLEGLGRSSGMGKR